jgi:hypothetical protein
MKIPDIEYVYDIIRDIETVEYDNNESWGEIYQNARAAERMKAWEKIIYWALDGVSVS